MEHRFLGCVRSLVFTHISGSRGFERSLQKPGPELGQVLVEVESRAPIVLTQVRVEIPVQAGVLGVQGAERRQHLLQGALRTTVQLGEIGWTREEGRGGEGSNRRVA